MWTSGEKHDLILWSTTSSRKSSASTCKLATSLTIFRYGTFLNNFFRCCTSIWFCHSRYRLYQTDVTRSAGIFPYATCQSTTYKIIWTSSYLACHFLSSTWGIQSWITSKPINMCVVKLTLFCLALFASVHGRELDLVSNFIFINFPTEIKFNSFQSQVHQELQTVIRELQTYKQVSVGGM